MKNKRHYLFIVFVALVVVLGIYFVALSELDNIMRFFVHETKADENSRGLFGDSTGAINTLFSSLAFAGVILTLYWQIQESSKNKEEDHRKQFEDVFFRMTDNFEQIISGLKIATSDGDVYGLGNLWGAGIGNKPLQVSSVNDGPMTAGGMMSVYQPEVILPAKEVKTGREVFQFLYEQYVKEGYTMVAAIGESGIDGYEAMMEGHLDHYFRYFYRILRYIDDSQLITDSQKYGYATILRAHLSSYEMLIMHYNGISSVGCEKLKPLIEKYAMLNNIREERLVLKDINEERKFFGIDNYYADSAFKHHLEQAEYCVRKLKYATVWSLLLTIVGTFLVLPLWNRLIVNTFLKRLPSDSFPFFFCIVGVVGCYIFYKWRKDVAIVNAIHTMTPTDEKRMEVEQIILERFNVLPVITSILSASLVAVICSDYYLTGGLSFCCIYVSYLPIVYHVFALIIIAVEIQDGNLLRNLGLLKRRK